MDSSKPPYQIFINKKNIIEVTYLGNQTAETISLLLNHIKPYVDKLIKKEKDINILFDFGKIGKSTIEANRRAVEGMNEIKFHKFAGINASPLIRFVTNTISKFCGKS